ncbi:dnc [Symbiodinium necroappetens]|uniref:Dnc protein n=1 Tax=Symbiodinium necroappetens TaxID=1628268 RepID=A0A813BR46_9DINO|nr:dnc [Symbiodinium necroappetens]
MHLFGTRLSREGCGFQAVDSGRVFPGPTFHLQTSGKWTRRRQRPRPESPGVTGFFWSSWTLQDADKDDVSDYGDDDGLSWYASAAADADAEEPAPEETAEQEQPEDAAVTDPYVTAESDPYEVFAEEAEEAPADLLDSEPKAVALEDDTGKRAAESEEPAKPPKPSAAPDLSRPAKVQRTEAPEPQLTQPAPLPLKQLAEVLQVPPAPEAEAAKAWTPSWLQDPGPGLLRKVEWRVSRLSWRRPPKEIQL